MLKWLTLLMISEININLKSCVFEIRQNPVLSLSLVDDRNGISLEFHQKCKQDIKMQIADSTIDNFPNISHESVGVLFVNALCVCGCDGAERKPTWGVRWQVLRGRNGTW